MSNIVPITVDRNIAFFDNSQISYVQKDVSENVVDTLQNTWFYDTYQNQISNKYNCFIEQTIYVNLFPGFSSRYFKNNILNSDEYKKEIPHKQKEKIFFNDSEEYKGNPYSFQTNVYVFKKAYGLTNPDPLFEVIENEPFEDAENIESPGEFLKMSNELKYPRYFNKYSLSRLNSNISVFGTIEEIDGQILTEKPLQGLKCEIVSSSTDARDRAIKIVEKISPEELSSDHTNRRQQYRVEAYSDEEYADLVVGNDSLLERSFSYVTKIINGQVYTVVDTSQTSYSPRLSNKIIFYTEDDNNIIPFNDEKEQNLDAGSTSTNNDGSVEASHGNDTDNSDVISADSPSFSGEKD